jgi:biotin carboxylase
MASSPEKILLLGASWLQVPPILYARDQGYHVITCDNRPDNPGHQHADESHNVSTTDIDGVVALATELKVDGVLAYASDPSVLASAVAAEKLGLPGNPSKSVEILTHKNQYRKFLNENQFVVPNFRWATSLDEANIHLNELQFPVIVKPVDSSGSKGVNRIETADELESAFQIAMSFSRCKTVIMEELVPRAGHQITGDGFIVDGRLAFLSLSNEHYNLELSTVVPVGESFPWRSEISLSTQVMEKRIWTECEKLISKLGLRVGAFNVEIRLDDAGNVHLLEFGPRNGGNLMPEAIRECTGVDLIAWSVEAALGHDCSKLEQKAATASVCTYMLHAENSGTFEGVRIEESLEAEVLYETLLVKPGDEISKFTGSHATLGGMILKFSTTDDMVAKMDRMRDYVSVVVS